MKKVFKLGVLGLALSFGLAACGNANQESSDATDQIEIDAAELQESAEDLSEDIKDSVDSLQEEIDQNVEELQDKSEELEDVQ